MAADEESPGKYRVTFGNVDRSQVAVGDHANLTQSVGLSVDEARQLRELFADFRATVAQDAPAEVRDEAIAQADELERAVAEGEPDPGRVRRILHWFRDYAPGLAGLAATVVIHPIVGKAVEAAGELVAQQFRDAVEDRPA
jgi:hypothetical protein